MGWRTMAAAALVMAALSASGGKFVWDADQTAAPGTAGGPFDAKTVVIGKSLLTEPQVILCDEPTRGIDVGAKAEVFRTLRRLADNGLGVVFTTSDLKELMGAADRIVVMSHGRITGDFPRAQATEARVVEASTAGLHGDVLKARAIA